MDVPRSMKGNMAMHKPNTRIIRFESQGQITPCIQQSHVATWGIVKVELGNLSRFVEGVGFLRENHEVVAVDMDGVGYWPDVFVVAEI